MATQAFQQRARPQFPTVADDRTPIMEAAAQNKYAEINDYIAAGHSLNAVDSLGWNALHHAMMGDAEEAAVTLLNAGINPVQQNKLGDTPLMEACRRQVDTVITRIAKSGCHRDAQERVNGHTAVMLAILAGDGYAACILAENGADTATLLNKKNQTADEMARLHFSGKSLSCFENIVLKKKTAAKVLREKELRENIVSATVLDHGIKPMKTLRFGPKKPGPGTGAPPANG